MGLFKKHLVPIENLQYMSYAFDKKKHCLGFNESLAITRSIMACFGVNIHMPERDKPQSVKDFQQQFRRYNKEHTVNIAHVHCVIQHNVGNIVVVPTEQTRAKDVRMIRKINRDLNIFVNSRYMADAKSWGVLSEPTAQEEGN